MFTLFTSLHCLPVLVTFPVHFLTLSPCFGHFSCSLPCTVSLFCHFSCSLPYAVSLFWSLFLFTSLHCLPVLVTFPVHFLTLSPCFGHFSCSLPCTVSLFWSLFLFISLRCLPVLVTFPVHFLTLSPCFGHFSYLNQTYRLSKKLLVALGSREDHVNPDPHCFSALSHQVQMFIEQFDTERQPGIRTFDGLHMIHEHILDRLEVDGATRLLPR